MIKEYNDEIGRKLYGVAVNFIEHYEIGCEEAVYQCDDIIINAPYLVEQVCDIVGYYDYQDEDDE